MKRENGVVFLVGLLFLLGACSLPSATAQNLPTPGNTQPSSTASEAATQPPQSGETGQSGSSADVLSGSQADIQKSFPIPPQSQMTSPDNYDPTDLSSSFTITSQSSVQAVVSFYMGELPKQGWVFRYADANFSGGETQYWKKDNIYLMMDIGYEDGQLSIQVQYDRIDPQEAQKLPPGFPLPGQAEMIQASDGSWDFYIPEDYSTVTEFYQKQLSAMNWKPVSSPGSSGASGGCDDCGGGGPSFPSGVTPMPTATVDLRNSNSLSYTMPDGNEVDLTITPRQNEAILDVALTLHNPASAGLPTDVPFYPGAVAQSISPGSIVFQSSADMDTIEAYYTSQMKAAGWTMSGTPFEASGTTLETWTKGSQEIDITIGPSGDNNVNDIVIACPSCGQ
jgi:hypothetical protein